MVIQIEIDPCGRGESDHPYLDIWGPYCQGIHEGRHEIFLLLEIDRSFGTWRVQHEDNVSFHVHALYKETILEHGVDNDSPLISIILLSGDVSSSLPTSTADDTHVLSVGTVTDTWRIVTTFV